MLGHVQIGRVHAVIVGVILLSFSNIVLAIFASSGKCLKETSMSKTKNSTQSEGTENLLLAHVVCVNVVR